MGICLCKKHGETGVVSSISIDICEDILGRGDAGIENIYVVVVKVFDGNDFLFDQTNYISESVFKANNLNFIYEIHDELDEEKLNSFFPKTSGSCGKCFSEYLESKCLITK